eukprot:195709_1
MAPSLTYLSIVTLSLIQYAHCQTGEGCYSKTCSRPGQVRINAIFNANGAFLGGCNCGCDPERGNPSSPLYCDTALNFDPMTLTGDCSCIGHNNPPNLAPDNPALPSIPTDPGTPITVVCAEEPVCKCPVNHVGECTLSCTGSPDACVDAILSCNNDGYRCTVDCSEQAACSGATIFGPRNAALEVYCGGEEACEGGTTFEHRTGTDLYVMCDGATACLEAVFNFGSAVSYVECNGDPEACQGAQFNLIPGAQYKPGASFACVGLMCPEPLSPAPFDNSGRRRCSGAGDCSCEPGTNTPCELDCNGTPDACKDGVIECNSDGFDCVVNCRATNGCSGSTQIIGPRNAKLTVNCFGEKSCQGSVIVDGATSTDVSVQCNGAEACKTAQFNFGFGVSSIACNGDLDSCVGATFNLVSGAQTRAGAAFECTGSFCPVNTPLAFSNVISTTTTTTTTSAPIQFGNVIRTTTTTNGPSLSLPSAATSYCCVTSIPNFKPWAGRCWDQTTPEGCALEPNKRCVWDATNCLPSPPVNSIVGTGPCAFHTAPCVHSSDCCSETCTIDGLCQ